MAYKAPLPMRIFHYALWAFMLFLLVWFLLIPMFLKATAPRRTPEPESSSSNTSGSNTVVPVQKPATVTP